MNPPYPPTPVPATACRRRSSCCRLGSACRSSSSPSPQRSTSRAPRMWAPPHRQAATSSSTRLTPRPWQMLLGAAVTAAAAAATGAVAAARAAAVLQGLHLQAAPARMPVAIPTTGSTLSTCFTCCQVGHGALLAPPIVPPSSVAGIERFPITRTGVLIKCALPLPVCLPPHLKCRLLPVVHGRRQRACLASDECPGGAGACV